MAVCCGQFPWIHSILSMLLPQSCPDVYPTSLPPPSGVRGHSVSLLALTVVLALNCSTGGEGMYTRDLTHCVLCVFLYTCINCHCCTPHTLCNMIDIGHPLAYRSFKKALVSRPNPGCTVCMCMYIATQLHIMYNCTIYTIVYCVRVHTYMCMYCIRIHVLRFIELMYCFFVHCSQLLSMSPWSSKGTVQTSSPSSVDTVRLE